MDSIFHLSEGGRAAFLRQISQSFGCTFICLWSYFPQPSNCLLFMDGVYHEERNQPKSSSAAAAAASTRAGRLFEEYQKSVFVVDNGSAPGLAFKNNLPYIEFKGIELHRLASTETQLQFYQETGIKTAVFMGCKFGEIELGIPIETQDNFKMEMSNLFPEDFSRRGINSVELSQPTDQNPPSSSSSSLRSLSLDSPEAMPSFLYNLSTTSYNIPETSIEPSIHQQPQILSSKNSNSNPNPAQEAIQSWSQIRHVPFSSMLENDDAAITRAILTVISSSSPTSSTSHQPSQKPSAFKNYRSVLSPRSQITSRIQKQNIFKRAITFMRRSSLLRMPQEQIIHKESRPTSNQLHHMISERKRREKLNESFQALRSLLPPGSKKDKASVLSSTTDYLNSLKAEVDELTRKNNILEAKLQQNSASDDRKLATDANFLTKRIEVQISNVAETTSEARILDLRVSVNGEDCSMLDLAIRLLEFLKQLSNVTVMSVEADTKMAESTASYICLVSRLKIEGGEWDDTTFQEAVERIVDDLSH